MSRLVKDITRAAVVAAALFFWRGGGAVADFSTQGLLCYLTGLRSNENFFGSGGNLIERPTLLKRESGSYFELYGSRQYVLRTLSGAEKNIGHGAGGFGYMHLFQSGRCGVKLQYYDRSSSISWPFSQNRVHVKEFFRSNELLVSGFVTDNDRATLGVTAGKPIAGGSAWTYAVQLEGEIAQGVNVSLRYYSVPYDWGVDARFNGVTKTMFSEFQHSSFKFDAELTLLEFADVTLTGQQGKIATPGGFRGVPDSHAQVWSADRKSLGTTVREKAVPGVVLSVGYSREKIPGELGLWYDRSRYMRGKLDVDTHRLRFEGKLERARKYIPAVSFDRVSTSLDLSRGVIDSWPFTPKQIEVIGDKTWTFSGSGSIVSNGVAFYWDISERSNITTSFLRVYPDYRIRITTRDHLSQNPWNMIFGRRRFETDGTRYYDFASVMYRREFIVKSFSFDAGIQQLIPLHHAETKIPGKAPSPPSFPKVKFERPKRFGGLSVWGRMRYFF